MSIETFEDSDSGSGETGPFAQFLRGVQTDGIEGSGHLDGLDDLSNGDFGELSDEVLILEGLDQAQSAQMEDAVIEGLMDFPAFDSATEEAISGNESLDEELEDVVDVGVSDLADPGIFSFLRKARRLLSRGRRRRTRRGRRIRRAMRSRRISVLTQAARRPSAARRRIVVRLRRKSTRMNILAKRRRAIVVRAAASYRKHLNRVNVLDRQVATVGRRIQQDCRRGVTDTDKLRRLNRLNRVRRENARRAVRFAKLHTVAGILTRNSKVQSGLLMAMAAGIQTGKPAAVGRIAQGFHSIGARSAILKRVRARQVIAWRSRTLTGRINRLISRRARAGRAQLLLRTMAKRKPLDAQQQAELTQAGKQMMAIDRSISMVQRQIRGRPAVRVRPAIRARRRFGLRVRRTERIQRPFVFGFTPHELANLDLIEELDGLDQPELSDLDGIFSWVGKAVRSVGSAVSSVARKVAKFARTVARTACSFITSKVGRIVTGAVSAAVGAPGAASVVRKGCGAIRRRRRPRPAPRRRPRRPRIRARARRPVRPRRVRRRAVRRVRRVSPKLRAQRLVLLLGRRPPAGVSPADRRILAQAQRFLGRPGASAAIVRLLLA